MQDFVYDKVKLLLVERFSIDASSITPDVTFQEELGLDSIDAIDLLIAVNDTFEIEVPEKFLENVNTVGDLVTLIHTRIKK